MKAGLLQLAMALLIGITLAGCAGTGMKQGSYEGKSVASQGPWPASANEQEPRR